jgi:hypothetical protein
MKRLISAVWLASAMLGCVTRESLLRTDPVHSTTQPDAAVLCAAFGGLGQWVEDWDKRAEVVFDDSTAQPEFPWTKAQAALAATANPKFDPLEAPAPGKDLDLDKGPIVPAVLVSSALDRWKTVRFLPPPDCENVIVANGTRLNRLWKSDIPAGWRKFRSLSPGSFAVVQCSAPGYDPAEVRAIVSRSHTMGALHGAGVFFMLTKERNIWYVTWSRSMWVS